MRIDIRHILLSFLEVFFLKNRMEKRIDVLQGYLKKT